MPGSAVCSLYTLFHIIPHNIPTLLSLLFPSQVSSVVKLLAQDHGECFRSDFSDEASQDKDLFVQVTY